MPTPAAVLVEACVDSVESARRAQAAGAHRLELCAGLVEGGVTPSAGLLAQVRRRTALPVHVLIRPRGGDFLYDADETAVMLEDIATARRLGADGAVLGALDRDGAVDGLLTRRLTEAARPMAVTYHRAFDLAADAAAALETLVSLGIERVLTSGQAATAEAGLLLLRRLVGQAAGRIVVMAGGGVTGANAGRIVRDAGVTEVHLRGSRAASSPMRFRRVGVAMGRPYQPDEFLRHETDEAKIRAVVEAVRGARAS